MFRERLFRAKNNQRWLAVLVVLALLSVVPPPTASGQNPQAKRIEEILQSLGFAIGGNWSVNERAPDVIATQGANPLTPGQARTSVRVYVFQSMSPAEFSTTNWKETPFSTANQRAPAADHVGLSGRAESDDLSKRVSTPRAGIG